MSDYYILILIATIPSITAIFGVVYAVFKLIKNNKASSQNVISKFEDTRQAVMNTEQYESLKYQLNLAYQENIKLKRQINELLSKIDRIARRENEQDKKG